MVAGGMGSPPVLQVVAGAALVVLVAAWRRHAGQHTYIDPPPRRGEGGLALSLLYTRGSPNGTAECEDAGKSPGPDVPRGIGPLVPLAAFASVTRALGCNCALNLFRRGLTTGGRESCDAASRAPGGIATGGPTAQTSTKVDDALYNNFAKFPRPTLRVV